jgi:uncharacterized membrane protein YhaH (DUF805 family)
MGRFFSAKGRINRAKYFGFGILISVIGNIGSMMAMYSRNTLAGVIGVVILLVSVIANIMITIQRFHDLNRPGIHFLFMLIPFYNIYLAFVLLFKKGTEGPNQYGDDPLKKQ